MKSIIKKIINNKKILIIISIIIILIIIFLLYSLNILKTNPIKETKQTHKNWSYYVEDGGTILKTNTIPTSDEYYFNKIKCNGSTLKNDQVSYNKTTKKFSISGITESSKCDVYFKRGTTFALLLKQNTPPSPEPTGYVMGGFRDKVTTTLSKDDQQQKYITYGTGYEFNAVSRSFTLTGVSTALYKDVYDILPGKYIVSASLNASSSPATSSNVFSNSFYKVLSAPYNRTSSVKLTIQRAHIKNYPNGIVNAIDNDGLIAGSYDDYGNTTYYYKGAVDNNYVSFAGFIWRVVRINGDRSVRLILDRYTDNVGSKWFTSSNATVYATGMGYINYGTSTIKTAVESWYSTNIPTEEKTKVATTKFCSDKSGITAYSTSLQYFSPAKREVRDMSNPLATREARMTCPDSSNIYNLNVGLLTSDEVIYAGNAYINKDNYLYNPLDTVPDSWWLMSPHSWDASHYVRAYTVCINNGTWLSSFYLNYNFGIRPVLSLKSDTLCSTDSAINPGTKSNPYKC